MARHWFGDSPADFVIAQGDQHILAEEEIGYTAILMPGVTLWVWDYQTGDRVTDLLDSSGQAVEDIQAAQAGRIPRFRGPDGARRLLIGQAEEDGSEGEGAESPHRWTITSTDWPGLIDGLDERIEDLENAEQNGELVASAHPVIWTAAGEVETHRSDHPYVNMEGKSQTITAVRAQASVTTGTATVRVMTMDMDTEATTTVATLTLDTTEESDTDEPDAAVSDGTGVVVEVELSDPADEVEHLTVQVMIR